MTPHLASGEEIFVLSINGVLDDWCLWWKLVTFLMNRRTIILNICWLGIKRWVKHRSSEPVPVLDQTAYQTLTFRTRTIAFAILPNPGHTSDGAGNNTQYLMCWDQLSGQTAGQAFDLPNPYRSVYHLAALATHFKTPGILSCYTPHQEETKYAPHA